MEMVSTSLKTWTISSDWEGKWNPVEQFSNISGLFIHALRPSLTLILYLNIWKYSKTHVNQQRFVLHNLNNISIISSTHFERNELHIVSSYIQQLNILRSQNAYLRQKDIRLLQLIILNLNSSTLALRAEYRRNQEPRRFSLQILPHLIAFGTSKIHKLISYSSWDYKISHIDQYDPYLKVIQSQVS